MVLIIKQNKTVRDKNFKRIINKKIQSYINNPEGNLDLIGLPIYKLPKKLKYIDGYLDISNTKISELPRGLVIKYDLFSRCSNISELPKDIIINGDLYCYETPLGNSYSEAVLKDKYKIKGNIYGVRY